MKVIQISIYTISDFALRLSWCSGITFYSTPDSCEFDFYSGRWIIFISLSIFIFVPNVSKIGEHSVLILGFSCRPVMQDTAGNSKNNQRRYLNSLSKYDNNYFFGKRIKKINKMEFEPAPFGKYTTIIFFQKIFLIWT